MGTASTGMRWCSRWLVSVVALDFMARNGASPLYAANQLSKPQMTIVTTA